MSWNHVGKLLKTLPRLHARLIQNATYPISSVVENSI